jgi:hypothetical protein
MSTLTILVIRHAEKPGERWPGQGFTAEGEANEKSLVLRGWERAGAWAALFGASLGGDSYPAPTAIYAANPNSTSGSPSRRPFQTIVPLASRLKLEPVVKYAAGQEPALVAEIVGLAGIVLVSWEHKAICGAILPAIVQGQNLFGLPAQWDKDRFDVVLKFDRSAPGAPWSFRQLCPGLLAGDSHAPMP